jgi:type IV secretory pathway VirB9-like protein
MPRARSLARRHSKENPVMFKKALLLAVLFVLVAFRAPVLAGSSVSSSSAGAGAATFAHAWTNYSDKEKKSFLFGLATGVRAFCSDFTTAQKEAKPQEVETHFRDCFNTYAGMEPDRVIAAMNALYADSKNAMIPLDGAYRIAMMQARGDKVDEIIIQARKYGEGLKKQLEQQHKGQ